MLFHVRSKNLIKLKPIHHSQNAVLQPQKQVSPRTSLLRVFSTPSNIFLCGQLQSFRLNQLSFTIPTFRQLLSKQVIRLQGQNGQQSHRSGRTFLLYSFLGLTFGGKARKDEDDPLLQRLKMASQELKELLQHADQLFDENNFKGAIDLLKSFPDQNQYDIKWRLARALYSAAKSEDSKVKDQMIREGYEHVKEALALKDDDYAGHKWMAVLLDSKSGLDGIKERVSQLENVKKHMLKAVELNPEDSTSWYILGEFAFGLAELPWYTRKIVAAIFANPPSGTFEEALEYFEKAENLKNGFYSMNYLMLGKCYYQLNNKEKAKEWLTKAANVTVNNEDDKKCKEEGEKLLKKV